MEKLKEIVTFFIDTGMKWSDDRATRLAAALAYYMLFSMAPLLIILAGFAGRFLDEVVLTAEFGDQISAIVGPEATEWIISIIEGASAPSTFTLATIISLGIMFWGASNVFNHVKETLNTIWGIKKAPGREGILAAVRGRLLAFAVVFIAGLLLVTYVVMLSLVSIIVPILTEYLPEALERIPGWDTVQVVQYIVLLVGATLLFAFFYKILPDVEVAWRDVMIGAAFTSLLFGIGTFALSIYFRFSSVGSLYGAAGSIMVILMWFYYSAQIFLFGAEFTHMYATRYGSRIIPSDLAVAVETKTVEDDGTPQDEDKMELKTGDPGTTSLPEKQPDYKAR